MRKNSIKIPSKSVHTNTRLKSSVTCCYPPLLPSPTPLPPGHIQENLEDELVQEALQKGLDLRQYSREIESELRKVELRSVQDCIQLIYSSEAGMKHALNHTLT